jgi:hypothetical protein
VCGIVLFMTVIVLFVAVGVVLIVDTCLSVLYLLHLFVPIPVWICGPQQIITGLYGKGLYRPFNFKLFK